jgi:hypothetical protein
MRTTGPSAARLSKDGAATRADDVGRHPEFQAQRNPVRFATLSLIQRALLPRLMVLAPKSLAVTLTG